jgi:hypothetical protein
MATDAPRRRASPSQLRLLTLTPRGAVRAIVAFLTVIATSTLLILLLRPYYIEWYHRYEAPPLVHAAYGFTAGMTGDRFVIKSVASDGIFGRAGVRPGDIPLIEHEDWVFYAGLACGGDLLLRFWRPGDDTTLRVPVKGPSTLRAKCLFD